MLDLFSNYIFSKSLYSLAHSEILGDSLFSSLLSKSVTCGWLILLQKCLDHKPSHATEQEHDKQFTHFGFIKRTYLLVKVSVID